MKTVSKRFALMLLILLALGLEPRIRAAEPRPLHIWVEGPEQRVTAAGGWKNAWPFVSLTELERQLPVRFDIFYGLSGEEFFRADRYDFAPIEEETYFQKLKKASEQWLLTQANAALVIGAGPQKGSGELIRRYIRQGGTVLWAAAPTKEFADILPVDFESKTVVGQGQRIIGAGNLFDGVPLERLSVESLPAFAAKLAPGDQVLLRTEQQRPLVVWANRGKGKILLAPGLLPVPRASFEVWEKTDTEAIWVMVWQRLLSVVRGEMTPAAAIVRVEPRSLFAGNTASVTVEKSVKNGKFQVAATDRVGRLIASCSAKPQQHQTIAFVCEEAPGMYAIDVRRNDDRGTLLAREFVEVKPRVDIQLGLPANRYGFAVGEPVPIKATVQNVTGAPIPDAALYVAVQDCDGRTHHAEIKAIPLPAKGDRTENFNWTMRDLGTRGWFFWLIVECRGRDGLLGRAVVPIHRFKHYSLHEQWQWSAWTNLGRFPQQVAPSVLRLFEDAGLNALGHDSAQADWPWCYRWGLRQYAEIPNYGGIDNLGWPQNSIGEFADKIVSANWPRITQSSVAALASYGEEPGFGPAFGATWHWNKGPAPEGANRAFRQYLGELYGNTIAKLNAQWQTSFGSFNEIQLDQQYGGSGRRGNEDLERMGPVKATTNLSRYVDSHAFYHWYFHRFNHQLVKSFAAVNPTAVSVMSMDNEFMTQLEQVGMYVHWLYPKEWMQCYLAYQRQFAADPAGFVMNWGFFDDDRINDQIFLLSLMQGANAFSFWYDFPLQFNYDLTHTRASLHFRELRRQWAPKQGAILDPVPRIDRQVGIYVPLLDWKAAMGRPAWMLGLREEGKIPAWMAGYGGFEQAIYSALCENGYSPRFVGRNDFPSCKIIFVPYAQSIPPEDADAMRRYVEQGGMVVATPKLATHDIHGKPFERVPGEGLSELFGFVAEPTLHNTYQFLGTWPVSNWTKEAIFRFPPDRLLPGGDPLRLQSFGYQPIVSTDKQTRIEAKYTDGTPAILVKESGKGTAVFLNLNYFWAEEWYTQFGRHREAFRIFLEQILKLARVDPPFHFLEMNYQLGIHEPRVGVYPFVSRDGSLTYLRLFCDWRATPVTALLRLRNPVEKVIDVMTGEELASTQTGIGPAYVVSMHPAQGRILALLRERLTAIRLHPPNPPVHAGDTAHVKIELLCNHANPLTQSRPVHVTVTDSHGAPVPMLERDIEVLGQGEIEMPLALSDAGSYRVIAREGCENVSSSIEWKVNPSAPSQQFPKPVENYRPQSIPHLVGADSAEFLDLLGRLKEVYLHANGDKVLLSAHLASRADSRHALCARLGLIDWANFEPALIDSLRKGSWFILGAEDLGLDPRTGEPLQPWGAQNQLPVVSALAARRDFRFTRDRENGDIAFFVLGKGGVVLFRHGPDSQGATPADFAQWHARFLANLRALGLREDGRFDLKSASPAIPIEHDLKGWLLE